MGVHTFSLDMFEVSERVLIVGKGREGEAKRILEPQEVKELFQRSDELNDRLNSNAGTSSDEASLKAFRDILYDFGGFLFELVFTRDLGRLFAATEGSLSEDDSLQIIIRIGSPNLASILWEIMREEHIYISHKCRFVRYPLIRKRCPENFSITPPAKMLIVAANPLNNLQIERELDVLDRALANLEDRVEITKLIEPNATFENIDRELKKRPHIFHFIGHAMYNHDDPETSFLVIDREAPYGEASYGKLPLESISSTLAIQPTSMIFLNACRTAGSNSKNHTDNFVNMAYSLIRLGSKAVVAMSHAISDNAATALSATFYKVGHES